MDRLHRADLERLIDVTHRPCVSLYLPTHRAGRDTREDPIRVKNALKRVEKSLEAWGVDGAGIRDLLAPLRERLDEDFWRHLSDGLAVFLAPGFFELYRLPASFSETVQVGARFHLKPMWELLAADGQFFLLALDLGQTRLFLATRRTLEELDYGTDCRSLASLGYHYDADQVKQFHGRFRRGNGPGGVSSAVYHSQADGDDKTKAEIEQFFRHTDRHVAQRLSGETAPLVLCCVEYFAPMYRETNSYRRLAEGFAEGSPESFSDEEMLKRAWPHAAAEFRRAEARARERVARAETGLQSADVRDTVLAAIDGRIDTLWLDRQADCRGAVDVERRSVQPLPAANGGSEDLIDFAATKTLANGGEVYAVDAAEMPSGRQPVLALLRY